MKTAEEIKKLKKSNLEVIMSAIEQEARQGKTYLSL